MNLKEYKVYVGYNALLCCYAQDLSTVNCTGSVRVLRVYSASKSNDLAIENKNDREPTEL